MGRRPLSRERGRQVGRWQLVLWLGLALTSAARGEAIPTTWPGLDENYIFSPFPGPQAPPGLPPPLLSRKAPPPRELPPLITTPALSASIPNAAAANCLRRDERGRFMGWMDYQHCVFSGRALMTARWFDDFFGDWYSDEASMVVRVLSQTVAIQSEGMESKVTVRASAALPNARKRLRLIVTDESEDNLNSQDVRRRLHQNDDRTSAALRWMMLRQAGLQSDFDIGVRGIDPPDLFARARLRKSWSLDYDSIIRFSQTLRYGSESRQRFTSQLDLEQAANDRTVLRLSNVYDYAADTRDLGFLWTHGVSLSKALDRSRSFSYGFSVNGQTQPNWRGESYGPWAVYRSPFLRPWLFYEVEPHYTWYRDRNWDGLVSVVLRLEMQFGFRQDR